MLPHFFSMLNKKDFEFLQPGFVEEILAEQESNETIAYAKAKHLIEDGIADFFLAPADATRVHYRTMNIRKEDAFSACGIFVATCLVEFDDQGNIIPSPLFKHRTNFLKADGSRPEYRAFEAAPRKEGHETWEKVASVKVTDLVFVPFDEEGVSLEETYQYKGTPEGFLKAQSAGINGNSFDFDKTIVSLGFLKGQDSIESFKKEMNRRLNQLGCTNGLFEVFIWGFASEVLTSSSESNNSESLFVNTNNFSIGARPYRTSNKKNGISPSNRGFTQGRDFASRLINRQKARDGKKVSPFGKPSEEEIAKAAEPAREPAPATKPEPAPAPATKPEPAPAPATKPEPAPATKPEPAPAPATKPEPEPASTLDPKLEADFEHKRPKAYARFVELGCNLSMQWIESRLVMAKSDDQALDRLEKKMGVAKPTPAPEPPATDEKGGFGETSEATDEFGINALGDLTGLGKNEEEDLVTEQVSVEEIMASEESPSGSPKGGFGSAKMKKFKQPSAKQQGRSEEPKAKTFDEVVSELRADLQQDQTFLYEFKQFMLNQQEAFASLIRNDLHKSANVKRIINHSDPNGVIVEILLAESRSEEESNSSKSRGRGRGMNANAKPAPTISQEEVDNKVDDLSNG